MKKTLENYKHTWKKESRGQSKEYKSGLKLGILASTNNRQIRKWANTLDVNHKR